jgi:transposase
VAFDPKHLPEDPKVLQQMVLDLIAQLDRECTERNKIEVLLRELLDARRNRKSEQLSSDQLALFAAAWQARQAEAEPIKPDGSGSDDDDPNANPGGGESATKKRTGGRQPLPRHLERERIVHDLAEEEKHCSTCQQDLRPIGEESSERYEYIPAQLTVIEDICKKYACACTVRTATKPSQPIEKSTAGASLLAQVIVAKTADHLPLHRQEKIFERHGVDISRKTMGGWLAQCADLLKPLYGSMKEVLFQSKVIGTDDTSVKVELLGGTSVSEDGTTNLVYTFTRAGVTTNSLTVNFSATGTASAVSDYGLTADTFTAGTGLGTVVFPANVLTDLTATLSADQPAFARTGGLHAAGLFDLQGRLAGTAGRRCVARLVGHRNGALGRRFRPAIKWAYLAVRAMARHGHSDDAASTLDNIVQFQRLVKCCNEIFP